MTPVSIIMRRVHAQGYPGGHPMLSTKPFKPFPLLPDRWTLRHYRTDFVAQTASDPAVRLLPALLTLPLHAAPLPDPTAMLALRASLTVGAAPASGRSLLLRQTAVCWAKTGKHGPPLYVALAEADMPNLPPRAVVAGAAHRAGLPADFGEGQRPGLLLLDDWELLPADRQALWQHFIISSAPQWPALRAVVALPMGETWPGLVPLTLAPPDDAQLAAWLHHLLPGQPPAPILAALRHESLTGLRGRLADLVLLALTYPLGGMPAARAQLYEQAYALVAPLLNETSPTGDAAVPVMVGRALLRQYQLARALAGGKELEQLAHLAADERAAVAPLAAGLLDDPTPVFEALWATEEPSASLRALTACVREAPLRLPSQGLRLLEHLASHEASPEARSFLTELTPVLPALLAAAGQTDAQRTLAALRLVATALPNEQWCWLELCDDCMAPAKLRWAAADLLVVAPPTAATLLAVSTDIPPADLLPRAFVAALASPQTRAALANEPLREALSLLLAEPSLGERRARVAQALVEDQTLAESLRCLALTKASAALLEQAAGAAAPTLRRLALRSLTDCDPTTALAALTRSLAHPAAQSEARREILDAIAAVPRQGTVGVLAWASFNGELPLTVQIHACHLLADQGQIGTNLLRRLLGTNELPTALRAIAARHLGRLGVAEALPVLATMLGNAGEPLLQRASATALGAFGTRHERRDQVAAALVAGLHHAKLDVTLGERIAHALGRSGAPSALPALTGLLAPELTAELRMAWLACAPALGRTPARLWPGLGLPTAVHLSLLDSLAEGGTLADPPSRLRELVAHQASRLAIAAAAGLAMLAATPALRSEAVAALRHAAHREERTDVARALLHALAQISNPTAELAAILDDDRTNLNLRWLAVEVLGTASEALPLLQQRLEQAADVPFVQTQMAHTLGAAHYAPALPTLHRIAREKSGEPQLRLAAITAIGQLTDDEANLVLTALAADRELPDEFRRCAATALPITLGATEQVTLRHTLRDTHLTPELAAALVRALARAGDEETLPSLIRSAESDPGTEAVLSIEAIAGLGDPDTAPLLVQLNQRLLVTPGVRLAAVGALLHLVGDEYLTLLREYLHAPSPPLRLQAHAILAKFHPADPRLDAPLAEPDAPLALRLQALQHLAATDPDAPSLYAILTDPAEQPQVRLAAATVLAQASQVAAVASLAAVVAPPAPETDPAPPILRRRCLLSLGALARGTGPTAEAARDLLAAITVAPGQAVEHRHWASEALVEF